MLGCYPNRRLSQQRRQPTRTGRIEASSIFAWNGWAGQLPSTESIAGICWPSWWTHLWDYKVGQPCPIALRRKFCYMHCSKEVGKQSFELRMKRSAVTIHHITINHIRRHRIKIHHITIHHRTTHHITSHYHTSHNNTPHNHQCTGCMIVVTFCRQVRREMRVRHVMLQNAL